MGITAWGQAILESTSGTIEKLKSAKQLYEQQYRHAKPKSKNGDRVAPVQVDIMNTGTDAALAPLAPTPPTLPKWWVLPPPTAPQIHKRCSIPDFMSYIAGWEGVEGFLWWP